MVYGGKNEERLKIERERREEKFLEKKMVTVKESKERES